MEVNVHHAKTHLSKLIEQVESGEEVIIARAGKPVAKLVALPPQPGAKSFLGCGTGKVWISDDFSSSETDREIAGLFAGGGDEFLSK
jgi:prevent-host-death family protein